MARADVAIPKGQRERRRNSHSSGKEVVLQELAPLRDTPSTKREELFKKKLELCTICFDFEDAAADKRGKETKRSTLLELVDYVNAQSGQKIFTEALMPDIMAMVKANICRALPPNNEDFDPEEDEPILENSWPHLQVVYEFFLRFIVSSEVNAKTCKKYADQPFCFQLIELFDSEDPRERDYLKTILHRIYGKFMSHRSFIRKTISNVFYRFVYETERHNGIGELLEILGSIINGFAIPLKKEHLQFLQRALIPLHMPKCVGLYHQQLSYCIVQYIEKDPNTAISILRGLFKYWPWSSAQKQVLFMNELEEILELVGEEQLEELKGELFRLLANCVASQHFQVVERTLFLWNNETLCSQGCLSRRYTPELLPMIYGDLYEKSENHWNATVLGLAVNVLKMYHDSDMATYQDCQANYLTKKQEKEDAEKERKRKWEQLDARVKAMGP
jgi:serine/threonine-protein phosphatase 2A regulatory subunit B'